MSKRIGIDLGTTFSLVSFINAAGKPELIPNSEGVFLTPSVVWVKDGFIEVGERALNLGLAEPEFLATQMKRNMGDDSYRFQGLTATEVSANILKKLKRDAESHFNGETVDQAVITVPAYFTDGPLKATKQAGKLAGLEVLALPKEPTAAALYYGAAQMKNGEKVMVCDLGGGTMDATILEYSASEGRAEFTVLSSDGSRDLGGEDWTAKLVEMIGLKFEEEFGVSPHSDRSIEQSLIEHCELAKRTLSLADTATVMVGFQGKTLSVPVTREEFEEATAGLLEEALQKAQNALSKSGIGWSDLSRILLVGGSTRMKMVANGFKTLSGIETVTWGNPDQLVALGAALYTEQRVTSGGGIEIVVGQRGGGGAVQANQGTGIVISLKESTTHGLGTIVVEKAGSRPRLVSSVIIKPRTEIPAESSRADYQAKPRQTEVDVPVVQVDHDGVDPDSCIINKTYRFSGIPDRDAPSPIRVTFYYDKDNMIDVSAVDIASGQTLEKMIIDFALPSIETLASMYVVLILDTSGSMAGHPLAQLKIQVKEVCNELMGKGCEVGIVEFGAGIDVVCPLTNDFDRISKDVDGLVAGGGTPMAQGIRLTSGVLREIEGSRVAILVSDGFPDSQPDARLEANRLKELGVTLYTISIGTAGADFLRSIGDAYTQIQSASDLAGAIGKLLWSK
jgi:molecular chaperone DnaK